MHAPNAPHRRTPHRLFLRRLFPRRVFGLLLSGLALVLGTLALQTPSVRVGEAREAGAGEGAWPASWRGPAPRQGEARQKALRRGGGTAASERRLAQALAWLAAHQDPDGRLDADGFMRHDPAADRTDGAGGGHHGERVPCPYDGATTAVALLAWLGDGSTPTSGPYADNVKRGLAFCVSIVRQGQGGFDALWNHAFCTQAVADAYRVTHDAKLRPVLKAAVRTLLARQLPDGGWRYFGQVGGVPSTSCAAVALALCAQAGLDVPKAAVERILTFLDARVDPKSGRSEYHDKAERLGYTPTVRNAASALAARALLGVLKKTPGLRAQVAAVTARAPRWKISFKKLKAPDGTMREFQVGNLDPYAWYYTSLALAARPRTPTRWFGALRTALAKGQKTQGAARGSWDPLGTYSDSAGRVFVTALCALMLEAPYRYPR